MDLKCAPGCTCGRHRKREVSAQTRAKISASKMGHEVTEQTRAKIGAASRGRPQRPESIAMRAESNTKHGMWGSPEYRAWDGMKQRCLNPNAKRYEDYGGRGVSVAERWLKFESFYEDMGPKPDPKREYSLDRIDNDGNYEPGNCRWATRSEQQRNRPRFNPDKRGAAR